MGGRGLFAHTFTVLESAIDVNGHANNLEYLRWMQEVATAHSDACGWTLARYQETRTTWVIRSHAIDYLRPAFSGETLKLLIDTEAGRPRSIPESFRAAFDVVADEQEALQALRTGDI